MLTTNTNLPPSAAAGSSAETQAAAFASDPRVYYSKESETWQFEDDDGKEMEWDAVKGAWVAILDEDLVKAQQAAYSIAGVDEETPAAPVLARVSKKRKGQHDNYETSTYSASSPSTAKRSKNNTTGGTERKSKNTAVYVTGLPLDAELDELLQRFGKCGVIEEDDEGEPKVKMYAREDGLFSGEALVVFFKEDSVVLAINLLDEAPLRLGEAGSIMRVQRADFGHKASGTGDTKPRKTVDKKKITKRIGKMQKKLLEWDVEDGFGPTLDPADSAGAPPKSSRVVILKHMFTLKELEEDASLLLDLKEDVRDECATLGEVTNVVLYDKEPEGIMSIKFKDPLSAQACVLKMNGRFFSGHRIEASLYAGRQHFRRSGAGGDDLEEGGDDAEKRRLDDFAKWLMAEGE